MIFILIPLIAAALLFVYLFLVFTERPRGRTEPFEKTLIAHRGLFGESVPENSLGAFARAAERGYGIELDVQLTSDGRLVVFHDASLKRMLGVKRKISELTYKELKEYRFPGTNERVPLFEEVLRTVDGRVPLIIEIKPYGKCEAACRALAEGLEGYAGVYCVESFDPSALRWFRKNRPQVVRGQLAQNYFRSRSKLPLWQKIAATSLLANFVGRPSFIAYNHHHRIPLAGRLLKKTGGATLAAWTVRSEAELEEARKTYSVIIFDSFIPSDNKY